MDPLDDPVFKAQVTEELTALNGVPFVFATDALSAWAVMCQLQLALRHPENTGETSKTARDIAQGIIEQIAPEGTALRQLAEAGWDEKYDA